MLPGYVGTSGRSPAAYGALIHIKHLARPVHLRRGRGPGPRGEERAAWRVAPDRGKETGREQAGGQEREERVAGEVEARWRLHDHGLKSNFSLQFANAQLAKTG